MPRTARKGRNTRGQAKTYGPDKNGRFWAVQVIDGKRIRKHGPSKQAAEAKLEQALAEPARALPSDNLGECLIWWREVVMPARRRDGRPIAPATVENYRWAVADLLEHLGDLSLGELTRDHVSAYLAARSDHYGYGSLKRLRTTLAQVLQECVDDDKLRRNVAQRAVISHKARPAKPRRSLTGAECTHLLDAIRGHQLEHLFALLLLTGARRGELLGLSWPDVDLERGTMTIGHGLRRAELGGYERGPTKTYNVRTVRLSVVALDHLRARREQQLGEQVDAAYWSNPAGLVFTTSSGRPFDPPHVSQRWRQVADTAGLGGVVLHELRHTLGSHAVAAGVPLGEVADQLGHSTLDEVSRTYRHAVSPVVEGVANVMDAFAPETPTA